MAKKSKQPKTNLNNVFLIENRNRKVTKEVKKLFESNPGNYNPATSSPEYKEKDTRNKG
jgi:hypothetical protein